MKLNSVFAFLLLLALSISCNEDIIVMPEDCIDTTIKREKMIPYRGQELDCKFYLALYILNEQKYFVHATTCPNVDMMFAPFDCEGAKFCDPISSECVTYFQEHATYIGIVGYQENEEED